MDACVDFTRLHLKNSVCNQILSKSVSIGSQQFVVFSCGHSCKGVCDSCFCGWNVSTIGRSILLLVIKDEVSHIVVSCLCHRDSEADTLIWLEVSLASDVARQLFDGVIVNQCHVIDIVCRPVILQSSHIGVDFLHHNVIVSADYRDLLRRNLW